MVGFLLGFFFLTLAIFLFTYRMDIYSEFHPERITLGVMSIILAGFLFSSFRLSRAPHPFLPLFLFVFCCYMVGNISIYSKWNLYKSPRYMAGRIKPFLEDGTPWVYYGGMRAVYVYYVGRQAIHVEEDDITELKKTADRIGKFFIVTRKRDGNDVLAVLPDAQTVFEKKVGETPMIFIRYDKPS